MPDMPDAYEAAVGEAFELMLRRMAVNPPGCAQEGCSETATSIMNWPGNGWSPICTGHLPKAFDLAQAMGFTLAVRNLPSESEARAYLETLPETHGLLLRFNEEMVELVGRYVAKGLYPSHALAVFGAHVASILADAPNKEARDNGRDSFDGGAASTCEALGRDVREVMVDG